VSTLVVCVDRGSPFPDGVDLPVAGREAVGNMVTGVGVDDPENSRVNTMLEGLRVARDLRADGDDAIVAILGDRGEGVGADRSVARQLEELLAEYEPESAIVIVDSAEDERLVPIVESRLPVDAVDRVVVRQARDIESTYYLLKQFLADEELRKTVLVPVGVALIAFPLLLLVTTAGYATGSIAAAVGAFLIYKGLGIDAYLARLPGQVQEALYSGRVSLVTYAVAAGLALVGIFAGVLGTRAAGGETGALIDGMRFAFESVPWLTAAALAAATGRLIDEYLTDEGVRSAYVNLPFGVVAVGLVVRGFSGYFLERAEEFGAFRIGGLEVGPIVIEPFSLEPGTRLGIFILAGVLVSLIGVRYASYFTRSLGGREPVE